MDKETVAILTDLSNFLETMAREMEKNGYSPEKHRYYARQLGVILNKEKESGIVKGGLKLQKIRMLMVEAIDEAMHLYSDAENFTPKEKTS